jgi:hypothetical protein
MEFKHTHIWAKNPICISRPVLEDAGIRILLRDKQTKLYCDSSKFWTAALAQALDFRSVQQATRFALEENVPEAEIVVRCDLVEREVAVPIVPEWCDIYEPGSYAPK